MIIKFEYSNKLGLHDSWRLSHWSKMHKGSKLFGLTEASGQMSVPQTGLYFVYAQVPKELFVDHYAQFSIHRYLHMKHELGKSIYLVWGSE